MILEPLASDVMGKNTIYYVPSGLLHQIALESLPLKDGTLLGEHYNFVRLTSAREIVRMKGNSKMPSVERATLYGALQYDVDTGKMATEAKRYKQKYLFTQTRGEQMRGSGKWDMLENAKEEIDAIASILKKHHVAMTPLTGTKGTEESFFAMSGKAPQILHVATHGFYYTPEKAKEVSYLNGYQDAMQLSGLIMAGGNAEWTGKPIPKGVMGGVLTANDIASLDLRETELLVLSACQTGLGKVTPEGIYGLQRAFKKAGVQTIVMSLWNISDKVTKDFMVKFYEELTGPAKWNKRKAFEEAKKHIRDSYKDEPYYWAGFVMLD
jgi:CHAT domain-containing protein